ncbi:MAG: toll/interleukin-1 receptor domain-containing protein [Actinomycetota bacterium]|nr:toll/interleukin-1 receptor domain-containing protein [Actinomycetota bacterium]
MTTGTRRGQNPVGVDFFISHSGRDQAWAEWVAWHLVEVGYTVELDCWDWAAGDNFLARMLRAVTAANRVVALFSSAYFEEIRYTANEWTSALVKNDQGGHRLMPVQVESCVVPSLFRPLLRVELFDVDEHEAARRLLAAARGPVRPDGKPEFPGSGRVGALTGQGESGPRLPGAADGPRRRRGRSAAASRQAAADTGPHGRRRRPAGRLRPAGVCHVWAAGLAGARRSARRTVAVVCLFGVSPAARRSAALCDRRG